LDSGWRSAASAEVVSWARTLATSLTFAPA